MTNAPRSSLRPLALDLTRRPRRNRKADWARRLVRENVLTTDDLIWPIFVVEGENVRGRRSPPCPASSACPSTRPWSPRDEPPSWHSRPRPVSLHRPRAAATPTAPRRSTPKTWSAAPCRAIKEAVPQLGLITDVALDPYTSHGHDGVLEGEVILNDESVTMLVEQALNQARAGADVIAPSDMMDGRVGAIRAALDAEGFHEVQIMAYAAKYASAFYGPFRDAIGTKAVLIGDKRTYQMDPANSDEALREVAIDLEEGADMVMVKPGMPYLDIIRRVKDRFARTDLRLSSFRRICHDHGGGAERVAGRRQGDDGEPAGLQTGGSQRHPHLFRAKGGGNAENGRISQVD